MLQITQQDSEETESERRDAGLKAILSGHGPHTGTKLGCPQTTLDTRGPLRRVYHTSRRAARQLPADSVWTRRLCGEQHMPGSFYLSFPWTSPQHYLKVSCWLDPFPLELAPPNQDATCCSWDWQTSRGGKRQRHRPPSFPLRSCRRFPTG